MLKARLLFLSLVVCLLVGCFPIDSLNPLFTDKDLVLDPALLGSWEAEGTNFKFVQAGEHAYQLILTDKEDGELKEAIWSAHLINLQGQHFLDVTPQTWSVSQDWDTVQFSRASNGSSVPPRFIQLDNGIYLEFRGSPAENPDAKVDMRVRPTHWIFKVATDGQQLQLSYLDDRWIAQAAQNGLQVDHVMVGTGDHQTMLVTANTADLQRLVLEHSNDENAFIPLTFKRAQ